MAAALPAGSTVAVFGAGAMGAGIAQIAALAGHPVQLHDARFGAADAAKKAMAETFAKLAAKGKLAAPAAEAALARVKTVGTLRGRVHARRSSSRRSSRTSRRSASSSRASRTSSPPDCIIASNTSSLSITALAAGMKHPERVRRHALLQSGAAAAAGRDRVGPRDVARRRRHDLRDGRGVGQVAGAREVDARLHRQPLRAALLRGGAAPARRTVRPMPATLDAVMRDAGGFRMGPFELMDLIGLDVNLAVTRGVWEAYFHDPRYAPSVIQQELVAAGRLGRKSGRGFYDYCAGRGEAGAARPAGGGAADAPSTVHGELGIAAPIADRIAAGGVAVEQARADSRFPGRRAARRRRRRGRLARADRRPHGDRACRRGGRGQPRRCSISRSTTRRRRESRSRAPTRAATPACAAAVGALQAAGFAVCRLDDVAGLAVMRTVAMLANEAAEAVTQGVAAPARDRSRDVQGRQLSARSARLGRRDRRARTCATSSRISPRTTARIATACRRCSRGARWPGDSCMSDPAPHPASARDRTRGAGARRAGRGGDVGARRRLAGARHAPRARSRPAMPSSR